MGGWRDGLSCILTQRSAGAIPRVAVQRGFLRAADAPVGSDAVGTHAGNAHGQHGQRIRLYDNHVEPIARCLVAEPIRPPDLRIQGRER